MADKIKGITVSIGGDTGPLSKAIKSVNAEIKTTQTQLKEVEKLLKLDPKNTDLLKEKQKLLGDQIKSTKKELDALKQAQQQAAQMLKNGDIGQAEYDNLSKKIEKAEGKLESLEKEAKDTATKIKPSAESIADSFEKAGSKIEAAGKKLAPFSAIAAAGLGASVKAASDWETAFTGVKKTVDATDAEYAELAEGIKSLALTTSSSAEDIAAVAEAAGQLGVGKDDLLEFVETMINLGDTTNVSATDAATSLARFTTVTGSSKKDVKKLGSAIVALGNNFATDEASIINMSQRLAAAGKIAGLSETDILALAASMSSVGIEAEAGGTAMTQTLTSIDKIINDTSKKGKKKMETLAKVAGMSADDFAKAWKSDPITAVQAFIGGLGQLDAQGESSTAVLDELGMSGVRQSNMLKSLGLASETLAKAVGTANTAYGENTALTAEAEKRYGTFESQVSQTKEAMKQVGQEIGEVLMPIISDLLGGVKDVVAWFKSLDGETKKTIVTITGIVAAAAPVLTAIGKISKGLGSTIKGMKSFGKSLGAWGGPIALAVAGIGALVAVIASHKKKLQEVYKEHRALSKSEQALKDKIDAEVESWKAVKDALSNAGTAADSNAKTQKDLWGKLKKVVDENGNVTEGFEDEAKLLTGELSEALGIEIELVDGQIKNYKELAGNIDKVIEKKKAEAVLAATQEAYTEALTKRSEAALTLAQAEANIITQEEKVAKQQAKVDEIQRKLNQARKDGNDETGAMAATIEQLEQDLITEGKALTADKAKLTELNGTYNTAKGTLEKYDTTIGNHDALQKAVATGSTKQIQAAVKNLTTGFVTAETGTKEALVKQTLDFIREYGKQRDTVNKTGSQAAKDASYQTGQLVNKSIAELEKLDPKLAAEMREQLNTINKASQWANQGKSNAQNYNAGVKDNVGGKSTKATVTANMKDAMDQSSNAYGWAKDMVLSYARGITNNQSTVWDKVRAMAQGMKQYIHFSEPDIGPLSDFHTYAPDMMKEFAAGIANNEWMVMQAAQGMAANLKSTLEGTTLTAQLDQSSVPIGAGLTLNIANFNNYSDSDIRELTNEIMETAASFAARKGAVFA